MKRRQSIRALALGAGLLATTVWAADSPPTKEAKASPASSSESLVPSLPVTQYTLDNGLTVLLSEDHALPSVAVQVIYLVGSGHEVVGRTGFAHLFEHLMFQGSKHFDHEYFAPFEPIGARTNGTTNSDRTVYYEQVPRQFAELSLWMESDRMRSLLPVLTQEKLDNQRDVVKNERRQRYEITPYGLAWTYLDEALYPVGHPYHHSTIGSHEDLSNATLSDVREFFEKYYVPSNAALAVVGDFEDANMRSLIEKYFGDMPSGKRAPTPTPAPVSLPAPKHWIAEDTIQLPRVYFAWLSPALFAPGDAELDLLSNVLSSGKSSRLFQSLVYEQKLAKDVDAFQVSQKLNGMYVIQATAAPGTELDELASALQKELTLALATPPSESEMNRARNDYKKGFFHRLETYDSRAGVLASYFLHTGKGDYVKEDYERYLAPTGQAVQDAGQKYLNFQHAVRLDFVPGKKSTPLKKLELNSSTPKKEAAQ